MTEKKTCKGCKNRKINCHSSCEIYLQLIEERQKAKELERKEKEYNNGISEGWSYARPRKVK